MKPLEKDMLILEYAKLSTLPTEAQNQSVNARMQEISDILMMTDQAIMQSATQIAVESFNK